MINKFRGIKHICFDLDGTLVKSHITIYKTTVKALVDLKIPTENLKEDPFYERIGHHFEDIFEEMKVPVTDFETFINIYKNQYFDFISESTLYDGINEMFDYLKSKNILTSLLTTKGQEQADKIIDHFGLRKYFDVVSGRKPGVANKPSAEPLLLICKELNVKPEDTIMVGDTELDIQCGKNANAKTIALLHGYRTKKALEEQEPDKIIENFSELKNLDF
ncbi:MAG TPA: HAD family hydrolase [Ignavibacteriaceae bacterium]|nr:HAD family hydrolase [Ignavibacteriaceae bacterium]